jgi:hypothetical protein
MSLKYKDGHSPTHSYRLNPSFLVSTACRKTYIFETGCFNDEKVKSATELICVANLQMNSKHTIYRSCCKERATVGGKARNTRKPDA